MMVARRPGMSLPAFFILLFLVSWIGTVPMILASYGMPIPGPLRVLQLMMLFGPAIAAFFAAWKNGGRPAMKDLLRAWLRWRNNPALYAAVLAGPAAIFALSLIVSNAAGFTSATFPSITKFLSSFGSTFCVYLVLNTEEIAWRGYALPRLQARMGSVRGTVLLAAFWILFHVPLFLLKGGHPAGYPFWLFALLLLGISLPFTAVWNATGSVLMPHLLHQSFNAAVEALPIYPAVTHSLAPVAISASIFLIASAVLLARKSSWEKRT